MKRNHAVETAALIHVMNPKQTAMDIYLPKKKKERKPYTRSKPKNNMAEKKFEEEMIWYLRNRGCIVSKSGELSTYNSHYILPGIADLMVWVTYKKQFAFVELKTETGRWSFSQQAFKKICQSVNIPYVLCRKREDLNQIL